MRRDARIVIRGAALGMAAVLTAGCAAATRPAAKISGVAAVQQSLIAPATWRVAGDYRLQSGGEIDSALSSISAPGNGKVWLAGTMGIQGKGGTPTGLLLVYDGGRLRRVRPPVTEHASEFSAVDAVPGGDVWVIGTDKYHDVLEHWDGHSWHRGLPLSRPSPDITPAVLTGLSANDVWATGAGAMNSAKRASTHLFHFDGSRWRQIGLPLEGNPRVDIWQLTARAVDDVWAIGGLTSDGDVTGEHLKPLIAHWNGVAWNFVPNLPLTVGTHLDSVAAGSPNDVWVVGSTARSPARDLGTPVVLHFDGRTWRPVPTQGLSAPSKVVIDGHGGVWVINGRDQLAHFDGRHWSDAIIDTAGAQKGATIDGLARDPVTGKLWALANAPGSVNVDGLLLELR